MNHCGCGRALSRLGLSAGGILLPALSIFLILAPLFWAGCQEQEAWDPEVAVIVNGRPIPKAAVERVLEWGFYPDLDQGGEREINIPLIVDKLINEELILDEARKSGLILSAAELGEGLDDLASAWFGTNPPPAEQGELRQALTRHLLLRKMTEKVMHERRVLSAEKWEGFWERWPKNRAPSFRVRALLLPPSEIGPQSPPEITGLDELAEYYKGEGQAVIVSQPLWLSGERLAPVVAEELGRAFKAGRLSLPVRLDESWAVYEVNEVDGGPGAAEEFETARRAFEALAGEEAFQLWLAEIRGSAKIEYAPSLGLGGSSSNVQGDFGEEL